MTKHLSRKTHQRKHKTSAPAHRTVTAKLPGIVIVIILAGIPFTLGKYIEFNTPGPFDSGSYVYSAKHILDGAEIGVDEIPSAQLGTLLVNMSGVRLFGYSETGPEIIQTIMQAAALVMMFIAIRKLYGTLAAGVAVIIASVYLSSPIIAKFGNVKEQYMIACMVIAASCFVLQQVGGKWYLAMFAGGFAVWAPLFKPTGVSVIGAIGLFVLLQPLLKNRTWKQTGTDIALLLGGAAVALAPLFIWIIGWGIQLSLPYKFAWDMLTKALGPGGAATDTGSYVAGGRAVIPFSEQWPRVLRYYGVLILPIALAVGAVVLRIGKVVISTKTKVEEKQANTSDRFVLLFALWWLGDMALVWVSPRSYEQYYLPLNASAAMLGGYLIGAYWEKTSTTVFKRKWILTGLAGLAVMLAMSWHVFFGIGRSPHSAFKYSSKRRGYSQKLREASQYSKGAKGSWEVVADYIRTHSTQDDKIYVWGWYPGIYVKAQRFSPTPRAFTAAMHTQQPEEFAKMIKGLIESFKKDMPKFIVDSRKNHIPLERPPHELWPKVPKGFLGTEKGGFLPPDKKVIDAFEKSYGEMLTQRFGEDEALRFAAVKGFRDFIMKNYQIVRVFGPHVLFELKKREPNPNDQQDK